MLQGWAYPASVGRRFPGDMGTVCDPHIGQTPCSVTSNISSISALLPLSLCTYTLIHILMTFRMISGHRALVFMSAKNGCLSRLPCLARSEFLEGLIAQQQPHHLGRRVRVRLVRPSRESRRVLMPKDSTRRTTTRYRDRRSNDPNYENLLQKTICPRTKRMTSGPLHRHLAYQIKSQTTTL